MGTAGKEKIDVKTQYIKKFVNFRKKWKIPDI